MSRWITFDKIYGFPKVAAVYAIYLDGQLAYIGQTSDLRSRMHDHKMKHGYGRTVNTPWGEFSTVVVKASLSRKYGDWAMRELRLIRRIAPWGNQRGLGRRERAA